VKLHAAVVRALERYDRILYAGLFLIVLICRLSVLQTAPLSGPEAARAWGALNLLRGGVVTGDSALYAGVTAVLFFLGGAADWLARLLPAFAGSALVLFPLVLRRSRGKLESFLLALLIAASPSAAAVSAQAGSAAPGLLFAALWIFRATPADSPAPDPRRSAISGVLLGLTLASGPVGWSGAVIAALCVLADWWNRKRRSARPGGDPGQPLRFAAWDEVRSAGGVAGLAAALILGGTAGLLFPRAAGALAGGMTAWLGAFFSGLPRIGEILLWAAAYEPLALVFGIGGLILCLRGRRSADDRFLLCFVSIALLWILLRPGALPDELVWILLPLLMLAARALSALLEQTAQEETPWTVAAQMILALLLLTMAVFFLVQFAAARDPLRLALAAGSFLGTVLIGPLFVEKGESVWRRMLAGPALGLLIILIGAQAGAGWNLVHDRRSATGEIWWPESTPPDVVRLRSTLEEISLRRTGVRDELPILVQWPEESALGWVLLSYRGADYLEAASRPGSAPAVFIAPLIEQDGTAVGPRLPADYGGQAFAVREVRGWGGAPPDLLAWWLYRDGTAAREKVVLWVRADLMGESGEAAP
jgi:hypothetical protein